MTAPHLDSALDIIRSVERISTPRGIQKSDIVTLGGVPQFVSIRGTSTRNPVLLFVHGGPGTPLAPTAWMWQRPVEEFFTVVHYDQRGAGRSHGLSDPAEIRDTLQPGQYVEDLIELTEWLRRTLDVSSISIAAHSWGTVVATTAVVKRPDLFSSYLGIGQVVDFAESERVSFDWLLDEARHRVDLSAQSELQKLEPYPGPGPMDPQKLAIHRSWVGRYGGFAAGRSDCDYFLDGSTVSPDLSATDRAHIDLGNILSAEMLVPHLMDITLSTITQFPIPIIQFQGRHDQMTPAAPVEFWMNSLTAPSKHIEWFEHSAHMPMYEEPGHFLTALLAHIQPWATAAPR